ncbi:MAG: hypothetical protein JO261_02150 [Alphaproteobacteria bacterium]|nr:hypothetical protein [Alphaproteobacteria bacterium]MBV9692481.1 hypothetical protein [Alphaproteobacteria bacterium]
MEKVTAFRERADAWRAKAAAERDETQRMLYLEIAEAWSRLANERAAQLNFPYSASNDTGNRDQ